MRLLCRSEAVIAPVVKNETVATSDLVVVRHRIELSDRGEKHIPEVN